MTSHDYIQIIPSGDVYAVAISNDRIVGACGPLSHRDMPTDPSDTDLGTEDAEWLNDTDWRYLAGGELLQYLAGQYEPVEFGY